MDRPKIGQISCWPKFVLAKLGYGLLCFWTSALHTRAPEHVTKQPRSTLIKISRLVDGARVETSRGVLLTWAVIDLVPLVSISILEAPAVKKKVLADQSVEKTFVDFDGA